MIIRSVLVLWLLGLVVPKCSAADTIILEEQYKSCWSSLSRKEIYQRSGTSYSSTSKHVSIADVEKMRSICVRSKSKKAGTPANVGITKQEIELHQKEAIAAAVRFGLNANELPRTLNEQDVTRALGIAFLLGRVPSTLEARVNIVFNQNPKLTVSSNHAIPYMSPWVIQYGNEKWVTHSVDVPSALSGLISRGTSEPLATLVDGDNFWKSDFWKNEVIWGKALAAKK